MENFEILEEKENLLFNRKEIHFKIESNSAPSREDIRKFISEKFSSSIEKIKVNKVLGNFGSKIFNVEAKIYDSKEDKDQTELKSGRSKKDDAPKIIEEKPTETKPEEQTPETPKEELKQEQTQE